jgi:hypothetical protein
MATALEKSQTAANTAYAIQAGSDAVTAVAGIIATIDDQTKRRNFEQNFSLLQLDQQNKLAQLVSDANSDTDRLAILTQALTSSTTQRINNIATMYAEMEKKKRNQKLLIGGGILLVGLIAVVIIIKKT